MCQELHLRSSTINAGTTILACYDEFNRGMARAPGNNTLKVIYESHACAQSMQNSAI